MVYLIQVIVYTALMYLIYILFLRNRPMHGCNRAYLLANVVLPLILPFIRMQNEASVPLQQLAVKGVNLPEFAVRAGQQHAVGTVQHVVILLYTAVSLAVLSISVFQWYRLRKIISASTTEKYDGYTVVANTGYGPGSWYKYIFLSSAETNETILRHERAHIRLRHTVDLILLTLVQVFFWPNIFLLLIRKELVQVHEFQADAETGAEKEAYATLLLSNIFGTCTLPSTHSFIIHPLKRRIMMLNKKSSPLSRLMSLLATGAAATLLLVNIVFIQSCKNKEWETAKEETKAAAAIETVQSAHVDFKDGEVKKMVAKMPEFNGDMMAYMGSNIVYPRKAIEKKVEGKVFVQFVVDKDGSVVNAVILKSPDELLSVAALDVVNAMPKWIPGETEGGEKVPVQFTLPVMFKL